MNEEFNIPRLLELRKLTRAISNRIEQDLKAHLATMAPLFSPLPIFGDYIRGGSKAPVKGAEKAFRELRTKFQKVAREAPYALPTEMEAPLDLFAATPTVTPVEYTHSAKDQDKSTEVGITSPLRWILSYPNMAPKDIQKLLTGNKSQSTDELRHCLLQCLTLEMVLEHRPGIIAILQGLRFSVQPTKLEGLGELPIMEISCPISTQRPPDGVIIESTEISGIPSFEEVIYVDDIRTMEDPFKQMVLSITERESETVYQDLKGT